MNNLFNDILANVSSDITVGSAVLTMLISFILGGAIAFTYRKTQNGAAYQQSLAVTLCMLPVILSVIIVFVGSDVARAFSLAGTLSIIRFRSAPGDPKDIGFIFFDIAAGLACGVGLFGYAILFVVLLCLAIILIAKTDLFKAKGDFRILKITIPENLNYKDAFDAILEKYTAEHKLRKIKTTDLGSLYLVEYGVTMKADIDEQSFIDELRVKNGNLTIMLAAAEQQAT